MDEEIKLEGNADINQALQEFEEKSKLENSSYKAVKFYNETSTPKIVQLVMKWSGGSIKEARQAEYVLLGFVIVAMAVSFYLFFGGTGAPSKPTPEQLEVMKQMMLRVNR